MSRENVEENLYNFHYVGAFVVITTLIVEFNVIFDTLTVELLLHLPTLFVESYDTVRSKEYPTLTSFK